MQFKIDSQSDHFERLSKTKVIFEMSAYEALILSAVFTARESGTGQKIGSLFSVYDVKDGSTPNAVGSASAKAAVLHSELVSAERAIMRELLGAKIDADA